MKQFIMLTGVCALVFTSHANAQDADAKKPNAQEADAKDATAPDTGAKAPKAQEADSNKPQTLQERSGYSYGTIIGRNMKESGIEIDIEQFAKALSDIFGGKESAMTEEEIKSTFSEAQEVAESKKAEAGIKWLAENGKKEGIKTTESGLQYEVITAGEGESPGATDNVTVHYKGTLTDGTEFDSSYSRGEPASFPLNGVIGGWTEGVQLMKPGAKYKFYIPHDLAYGERGSPPKIPPFSALVFEIELLKVNK